MTKVSQIQNTNKQHISQVPRGVSFRITPTSHSELLNGDEPVSTLTQVTKTKQTNKYKTEKHVQTKKGEQTLPAKIHIKSFLKKIQNSKTFSRTSTSGWTTYCEPWCTRNHISSGVFGQMRPSLVEILTEVWWDFLNIILIILSNRHIIEIIMQTNILITRIIVQVMQQVRSLQVLETVNLMAGGFPHR